MDTLKANRELVTKDYLRAVLAEMETRMMWKTAGLLLLTVLANRLIK